MQSEVKGGASGTGGYSSVDDHVDASKKYIDKVSEDDDDVW